MDGTAPERQTAARGALGPRGRGLFGRLLDGIRAAPKAKREALSIAIASGKGGTGKSFLATSLAVLAHRLGSRTAIVDCDFGLACDHLLLGVKPHLTLQQLLSGQATLEQVLCETPCGPKLLPGASGVRRMANLTDKELLGLARELGGVAATHDLLLLDLGAGIAPATVLTMLSAEWIVLVSQPEIAALVDAYAVVKCIAQVQSNARFLVLMNHVSQPGRGEQAFTKLTEVAKQHAGVTLQFLGELAEDDSVMQHRLGQLPLVASSPNAPMSRALATIATRLQQLVGGFAPREVLPDQSIEARFRQHRLFL